MTRAARSPASLEVVHGAGRASLLLRDSGRQLLKHLQEPDSAAGLARRLGLPRQRLNYHLKALEREGFVELVEERRRGNCVERVVRATARSYVISQEALGALGAAGLGTDPAAAPDRLSAAHLITSAANALRDVAALDAEARRTGKRLATLTLDADIRFASAATRAAFADDLTDAIAALVAKYHDETAHNGRHFRLLATVHPAVAKPKQTKKP